MAPSAAVGKSARRAVAPFEAAAQRVTARRLAVAPADVRACRAAGRSRSRVRVRSGEKVAREIRKRFELCATVTARGADHLGGEHAAAEPVHEAGAVRGRTSRRRRQRSGRARATVRTGPASCVRSELCACTGLFGRLVQLLQ